MTDSGVTLKWQARKPAPTGNKLGQRPDQATVMRRRFIPALAVVLLASLVVEGLAMLAWHPSMRALGRIGLYLGISCLLSVGVVGAGLWLMQAGVLRTVRARI